MEGITVVGQEKAPQSLLAWKQIHRWLENSVKEGGGGHDDTLLDTEYEGADALFSGTHAGLQVNPQMFEVKGRRARWNEFGIIPTWWLRLFLTRDQICWHEAPFLFLHFTYFHLQHYGVQFIVVFLQQTLVYSFPESGFSLTDSTGKNRYWRCQNLFIKRCTSKGVADVKLSPDVSKNSSNPHIQRHPTNEFMCDKVKWHRE